MKKNPLELQTFQQLCRVTSAYLRKLYIHFFELFFLKCNKNAAFSFKNTYNKENCPFLFESSVFVRFGGWLSFLNTALEEIRSDEIRS